MSEIAEQLIEIGRQKGHEEGKIEGKAEGKAEGLIIAKCAVARSLREAGVEIGIIEFATGLTREEILSAV